LKNSYRVTLYFEDYIFTTDNPILNAKRTALQFENNFIDFQIATGFECEDCESTSFILTIYDNGMGILELEIEDLDSLGMQLVTSHVDQLDWRLELKRNRGTEFVIKFTVKER